jgi:cytochrome P450
MLHDPDCFPNPDDFNPGRYNKLDSEMDKVTEVVFGFGRRVCPGKLFAEGTFFAIAATVLATCEILPVVDFEGNEVVPNITYSSGTIRRVAVFLFFCRRFRCFELVSHPSSKSM